MDWNLNTWLIGSALFCLLFVWDEKVLIRKLFRDGDTVDGSPLTVELVEKRVRKYRDVRLICGAIATFSILTIIFFGN